MAFPTTHANGEIVDATWANDVESRAAIAIVTENVNTVAASGAAQTIPAATVATLNLITLTAACTLTFPGNPSSGAVSFTLVLIQDGSGGRTVTWPGGLKWAGHAAAPTLTATAAGVDIFTFTNWGSGWYAFASGLNMG